jgi:LytS/YehU family sensor histidine kinase
MARQLAAAQIQPHFLFNSLASLQHWVQHKDDRAAPMLAALTAFLRATLPMFNRQRLALGDEAEAVRQYLAVMQMRLGERLRFSIAVEPAAAAAQVPPGLLLTLVENAVEHGVMPSLSGAEVQVQARTEAGQLRLTVRDTGPGLAPDAADGTGLANTRERLQQAYGAAAGLTLDNAPEGGCIARLHCPLDPT